MHSLWRERPRSKPLFRLALRWNPVSLTRALALLCLVSLLAACRGGSVTPCRFQHDAESLSSISADGSLLAHGIFKGETTDAYARIHASELGKESGQLAAILRSAHPRPGLHAKTAQLVALAQRASNLLGQIAEAPSDRSLAGRLTDALAHLSSVATKLSKSA